MYNATKRVSKLEKFNYLLSIHQKVKKEERTIYSLFLLVLLFQIFPYLFFNEENYPFQCYILMTYNSIKSHCTTLLQNL